MDEINYLHVNNNGILVLFESILIHVSLSQIFLSGKI